MCGKVTYVTRAIAKRMLKLINKGGKLERKLTAVYYCDDCLGYHLTSMNKKKSRYFSRMKDKQQ